MSVDTDILIIGAGMSGIGLAVQLKRKFNNHNFEIVEKEGDVGGTWLVNTYPGCGCDVASHFYSYSFALNPHWSQKFSLRTEIQQYFRNVAEEYNLIPRIQFRTIVETARWDEQAQNWVVTIKDLKTKQTTIKRARILVSGVGSLSIPKPCEIPGADAFHGLLFHSARWDPTFDWTGKKIVVLGNGCSATQFVPVMAETAGQITQFARSPHYLAERPNPVYGSTFKTIMKYVPFAMRIYRFNEYAKMERDFAGFDIESGASIRQGLKEENEAYVKRMAPEKYWDALIPNHEIGCKRKVMDTDYLACLHRQNVELVHSDPVSHITETGVVTQSGRTIQADAIIRATGFEVFRMLYPMEIIGDKGISLNEYWDTHHQGVSQAYLGTSVPGFKNFATLMGPNTVTGHLSVIYTVECQINYVLRLIEPILKSTRSTRSLLRTAPEKITSVDVKAEAAKQDSNWMQDRLKKLVWSSGCTSWALDPKTGLNIAMYPQYQFMFWLRSIFIPSQDFEYEYRDGSGGLQKKQITVGGWKSWRKILRTAIAFTVLAVAYAGIDRRWGIADAKEASKAALRQGLERVQAVLKG